jgi:hypothetical protein
MLRMIPLFALGVIDICKRLSAKAPGSHVAFPASDLLPVHDRAKRRMPWYAKSDDYPTDTTATKNMVTNTASTSMNMMVTPTSTLDMRV